MKTLLISAIAVLAISARANWTCSVLWEDGNAYAVDGNVVVGSENWVGHGGYWHTSGYVHGHGGINSGYGSSYDYSVVTGVHDGQQVGFGTPGGNTRALMWTGSPGSMIVMQPAGWTDSHLEDVCAGRQVGSVYDNSNNVGHAGIWSGTAASFQDLHPSGYGRSRAFGISIDAQVGDADGHAGLWYGSATSFVDLHPDGYDWSIAYDVSEDQQVGRAAAPGTGVVAALWCGSAASFVSLHPAGAVESSATGVSGGQQVGEVDNHAAYWLGTAASHVDLHSYLPAGYTFSEATDIWDNGDVTNIVGSAYDAVGGRAVMWTRQNTNVPVVALDVVRGIVTQGGLSSIGVSDDIKLRMRPGIVFSTMLSRILIQVDGTSPDLNPSMLSLFIESGSSGGGAIEQMVRMYDFDANAYETIELRMMTVADKAVRLTITDDPGRFVGPSGEVRAIAGYRALGPVFVYPWEVYVDRIRWVVPGT